MNNIDLHNLFSDETMELIFPEDKTDEFFNALYGDVKEGVYDIKLKFKGLSGQKLMLEFHLVQRPGKCLACNLTYGLPEVFSRHPIINIRGIIQKIDEILPGSLQCKDWTIGNTIEKSSALHVIPVSVTISDRA